MKGSVRNQFIKKCLECGKIILIKELNDGSPSRNYDIVLCPECNAKIHEDIIVGEFIAEVKK